MSFCCVWFFNGNQSLIQNKKNFFLFFTFFKKSIHIEMCQMQVPLSSGYVCGLAKSVTSSVWNSLSTRRRNIQKYIGAVARGVVQNEKLQEFLGENVVKVKRWSSKMNVFKIKYRNFPPRRLPSTCSCCRMPVAVYNSSNEFRFFLQFEKNHFFIVF